MRTRIFFIVFFLLPITLFAQNEHFLFKGIPIDGPLNQFSKQLTEKGYKAISSSNKYALLEGDFAGYSNCSIIVYAIDSYDLVYDVVVKFPDYEQWSLLEGNYNNIKEMLTTKYGKPIIQNESFQSDNPPTSDSSKLLALKMDRCNYNSSCVMKNGKILLMLAHDESYNCYVLLGYVDDINMSLKSSAAIDDL